ncbi:uncharacterized protein LOC119374422 [Rhipicephalus sanguineus]|uniref:uncharacterized protein LOC119374422 n=1 Tax=Rhipicephalus sanguineus TaxID=34632 RepID=UPI0018932997|nr:uncharacterized protein LOC119374422 [Rhipicephalus sanguineus]
MARPHPWDRRSILTTLAFFGGIFVFSMIIVLILSSHDSSKKGPRVEWLRAEPVKLARALGCNCSTVASHVARPYFCVCPKDNLIGDAQGINSSKVRNDTHSMPGPVNTRKQDG